MNLSFENKVALVTGAGSGMGLATAEAFAEAGAAVALVDMNEAAVRKVADRLTSAGHKVLAITCDVTDETQVKRMIEQTVAAFGRLDAADHLRSSRPGGSKLEILLSGQQCLPGAVVNVAARSK